MNINFLRRLLPLSIKKWVALSISNHFTGWLISKIFSQNIPHQGSRIFTGSKKIPRKVCAMLFFSMYERAEISQVNKYLRKDLDIIELGGSIGANTVNIAKNISSQSKFVMVEADPELCAINLRNLNQNVDLPNFIPCNAAIDYSGREFVKFSQDQGSLSESILSDKTVRESLNVRTITLEEIIKSHGIDSYVLVSDIEGAELSFILEDSKSLRNCQQIFLEIDGVFYKDVYYSIDDTVNKIISIGFRLIERHYNCVCFERIVC